MLRMTMIVIVIMVMNMSVLLDIVSPIKRGRRGGSIYLLVEGIVQCITLHYNTVQYFAFLLNSL